MYRIIHANKDTYITNKIVGSIRVKDANVGQAGTVDLFKLYDENYIGGETNPIELSRGLIHFDLTPIRELTQSTLDINDSSFKCTLKLSDVYGGQTTPSNFTIIVHPLSRSFDEGLGKDVVRFEDIDVCNFITSSVVSTPVTWSQEGASAEGLLGSSTIDIISSGNLNDGLGVVRLYVTQSFSTGKEDLEVDVTKIISGTIANLIPEYGFRIAFSGSQETDTKTRFVKRFASRNTTNTAKRPQLIVTYNDVVSDDHGVFFFDISGSLFLNNYHRGYPANILSGAAATSIAGDNCLMLKISSGVFSQSFTGSQYKIGSNYQLGIYTSSFAISSFNTRLRDAIVQTGSITFNEVWSSIDGTVGYYTGSLEIKAVERTSFIQTQERYFVNITNMRSSYKSDEKVRFRMFVDDFNADVVYAKVPIENTGIIVDKCFFRIRDFESDDVIVPFHDPGTQTSNDSDSHYFDFYMSSLPKGRTYTFDFKIINKGIETIINDVAAKFRVE
jgi:hypothetical protein